MSYLKRNVAVLGVVIFIGCSTTKDYQTESFSTSKPNTSQKTHAATMRPYTINGKTYYPTVVEIGDTASGIASWYGPNFHGKYTSNGERYNMNAMTAAHKTLPMNTMVKVTNLNNNKTAIVRINDRGPFVTGRVIDLSRSAAKRIDMFEKGTAPVRLEVVGFYGKSATSKDYKQSRTISGGNFMVQIGAFKKQTGAQTYKKQYNGLGGYKTTIKTYSLDDTPIYRVFLIGYRSEDEARDFIKAQKISGAFIVRE